MHKIKADLNAAQNDFVIVFDPPFTGVLYETLLNDLPSFGGYVFVSVRSVYSQINQISYIKGRLQKIRDSEDLQIKGDLFRSYLLSLNLGIKRIEEALEQLEKHASSVSFVKDLPVIADLSKVEREWWQPKSSGK